MQEHLQYHNSRIGRTCTLLMRIGFYMHVTDDRSQIWQVRTAASIQHTREVLFGGSSVMIWLGLLVWLQAQSHDSEKKKKILGASSRKSHCTTS